MINLPHKKPLRFANTIISKKDNINIVDLVFPFNPTLGMICEAVAQASASFVSDEDEITLGFLVALKDIEQVSFLDGLVYLAKIEKTFVFGNMNEFSFQIFHRNNSEKIYAKGSFTIALQS